MEPGDRRAIILEELRRWRAEGVIDEDTARFLEARYHGDDAGAPPVHPAARAATTAAPRSGFAAGALQFVGGLLLGAALVALVIFLDVDDDVAPWLLFAMGAAVASVGLALHAFMPERDGLGEALLSAGLVPIVVAATFTFDQGGTSGMLVASLAAAVAVAVHVLRKGRGPSIVVAGAGFTLASFAVADVQLFFGEPEPLRRFLWLAGLLAYLGLLLVWRRETWSTVGLALFVAPLTVGFLLILDVFDVQGAAAIELLLGGWLAIFVGIGVWLRNRGLVTGAAAGLTIDAVAFAFELGGPGTAVVVLLALGGLLVWQAEIVRAWFGGRAGGGERL